MLRSMFMGCKSHGRMKANKRKEASLVSEIYPILLIQGVNVLLCFSKVLVIKHKKFSITLQHIVGHFPDHFFHLMQIFSE